MASEASLKLGLTIALPLTGLTCGFAYATRGAESSVVAIKPPLKPETVPGLLRATAPSCTVAPALL